MSTNLNILKLHGIQEDALALTHPWWSAGGKMPRKMTDNF